MGWLEEKLSTKREILLSQLFKDVEELCVKASTDLVTFAEKFPDFATQIDSREGPLTKRWLSDNFGASVLASKITTFSKRFSRRQLRPFTNFGTGLNAIFPRDRRHRDNQT